MGVRDDYKKFLTIMFITLALIQMVVKAAERTDKPHIISKARALKLLANSAGVCMGLIYEDKDPREEVLGDVRRDGREEAWEATTITDDKSRLSQSEMYCK